MIIAYIIANKEVKIILNYMLHKLQNSINIDRLGIYLFPNIKITFFS